MRRHPNKLIQAAIDYTVGQGWVVLDAGGSSHAFCKIRCGDPEHPSHMHSIWCSPRSPERFARQIHRAVDKCPWSKCNRQ